MTELIDSTSALLAAQLRYVQSDDPTIRVLAGRENVDPDTDQRPGVLATVFAALVSRATRAWRTGGSTGHLAAAFDQYAGQLGPALADHWNPPRLDLAPAQAALRPERSRTLHPAPVWIWGTGND